VTSPPETHWALETGERRRGLPRGHLAEAVLRLGGSIMAGLPLTLALEHYDRHLPLLAGKVKPAGIDLHVVHVAVEGDRDERMLDHREWDACEFSLSSYLMAKARGAPLTAVPVFPRRLFSQSQMYINARAGIKEPRNLNRGAHVGVGHVFPQIAFAAYL
jgi:hypothetical protein